MLHRPVELARLHGTWPHFTCSAWLCGQADELGSRLKLPLSAIHSCPIRSSNPMSVENTMVNCDFSAIHSRTMLFAQYRSVAHEFEDFGGLPFVARPHFCHGSIRSQQDCIQAM